MNIATSIEQYNDNYLYFCEPIKNNIMNYGNFIRILYTEHKFTLTGIYILFTLHDITCEHFYNKYKCFCNITLNQKLIKQIQAIEKNILNKIEIKNKNPQYKIYEQLKNGCIQIFQKVITKDASHNFILKISGIWSNTNSYGLTYKFIVP